MEATYREIYEEQLRLFSGALRHSGYAEAAFCGIPYVFIPQCGTGYELATLKFAFIGKETYGWKGWLDEFSDDIQSQNTERLFDMAPFQACSFVEWTTGAMTRYKYWGFVMYFLARFYGIQNWNELKKRSNPALSILSSFAWGNANAIETASSSGLNKAVLNTQAHRVALQAAHEHLDSFELFRKALQPDIVLLTCSRSDCDRYLRHTSDKVPCPVVAGDDSLRAWTTADNKVIINIPHPARQKFSPLKADGYVSALMHLLEHLGMTEQGRIIRAWNPADRNSPPVLEVFAGCKPEAVTKYQAVATIASELRKYDKTIPAEALAWLLNELGHRTNYGSTYEGGRGTYRLIRSTYHRYEKGSPIVANDIAEAFTKPDGSYAYD